MSSTVPPIRAIVFDTNVFGKPNDINVSLIRRWALACSEHGAELWVPEIVVWELTEHTMQYEEIYVTSLRRYNKSREKWGMPTVSEPTVANLLSINDAIIEAGAVVVRTSEAAALEGLRNQILQEGPSSLKAGVKTGAADSAWLRSVYEYNGDTFEGLLIVSGDTSAVGAIGEEVAEEVQSVKGVGSIANLLGDPTPAPEKLAAVRDVLGFTLRDADVVDTEWEWAFRRITELAHRELPDAEELDWDLQQSSYEFGVVGDTSDKCEFQPWTHAFRAIVGIEVVASDVYARQNLWGDYPEYATVSSNARFNIVVTVLPDDEAERGLSVVDLDIDGVGNVRVEDIQEGYSRTVRKRLI